MLRWILFSFLSIGSLLANEKNRGFCFKDTVQLEKVMNSLKAISLPRDRIEKRQNKNCLQMKLSDGRYTLFSNFLRRRYKVTQSYTDHVYEDAPRVLSQTQRMCRIQVRTVGQSQSERRKIEVSKKMDGQQKETQGQSESTMSLFLMEGVPGHFNVDENLVELTCRFAGNGRFKLKFELQAKHGDRISGLSSVVVATKGVPLDVGSIVQKMKKDGVSHKIEGRGDKSIGIESTKRSLEINRKKRFYVTVL